MDHVKHLFLKLGMRRLSNILNGQHLDLVLDNTIARIVYLINLYTPLPQCIPLKAQIQQNCDEMKLRLHELILTYSGFSLWRSILYGQKLPYLNVWVYRGRGLNHSPFAPEHAAFTSTNVPLG